MSEFEVKYENSALEIKLDGRLDAVVAPKLSEVLKEYMGKDVQKVVFHTSTLTFISSAGLRVIVFAKQKMGASVEVILVAPPQEVIDVIEMTGFSGFISIVDSY